MTDPCDILVAIDPAPASNRYLVENDRPAAEAIAMHRGRYRQWSCGK